MAILGKRPRATRRPMRTKRRRVLRAMRRPTKGPFVGKIVSIKRTFNLGYWQPSTVSTSDFWKYYTFRFSDLPSYTEFQPLFDLYKINAIKVTFRPRFNSFDGANTTDTTLPGITNQQGTNLHIVVDPYSANTAPTGTYTRSNMNTFLENGKVRTYNGNKAVSVYFKPTILDAIGDGTVTRAIKAPWLYTGGVGTQHYGFHAFAQDVNMTGTFGQSWDIFVTYYMQFKGLK